METRRGSINITAGLTATRAEREGYNMANSIYTSITEATVTGARDRVIDELHALTNGEPNKAIKLVAEYNELNAICKEIEKKKEREAADSCPFE